jgi:DNA-directed RNA polymerase subunit K/omega
MSDNEDNYSVSVVDSDEESENYKKPSFMKNKKISAKPTISQYDDDDDDDDNTDQANDDDEDEDKIDENQDEITINEIDNDEEDDDEVDDDEDDDDDSDDDLYGDEDEIEHGDSENNLKSKSKSGGAKTDKNKSKQDKKQNTIHIDVENNEDYEDDDEDYQDDNYLQKFDKEMTKDYILDFHPECLNHNYDEIKSLSKVTRDEFNIIIDPLHKTVPFLTKYEKARILGQRAKQIECGAKPFVKVPENIIDSYIIAELELEQKTIPFIIRRPIPSGGSEYWELKDLDMISF